MTPSRFTVDPHILDNTDLSKVEALRHWQHQLSVLLEQLQRGTVQLPPSPSASVYLDGTGNWSAPAGGGGGAPAPHAPTHISTGTDPIAVATTSATGLLPQLNGNAATFLTGTGVFAAGPAGPTGPTGPAGANSWTLSTATFTVPNIGSTAVMSVADTSWAVVGEFVWVATAGGSPSSPMALQITAKTSTTLTLLNPPTAGMQVSSDAGNILTLGSDSLVYLSKSSLGLLTADTAIQVQEDFCGVAGGSGWQSGISGAALTVGSNVGCDATNKGAGVVSMTCGTVSGNRAVYTYGQSASDAPATNDHYVPGLGVLEVRFRVWISAIYSSATNYSIVRCGLITDDGTGAIKNGIYFEYNYAQGSGNWIATTASATVLTRNASATAVVAAQWMNLRILTDSTWANASFYVNGVLAKSISGFTLPVNSTPLNVYHAWGAGSGLSTFYMDYAYLKYSYSRGVW